MADQFVGEIRIVPFNFAPTGWAMCNGQILPISQNTALFSLLGTNFGGNGQTNFALPNLQDSVAVDFGAGAGLTERSMGETGGAASVTISESQLPQHKHVINASSSAATKFTPGGNLFAVPNAGPRRANQLYTTAAPNATMALSAIVPTGGGLAHNNTQPYLALNFIIALQGIFPPRS
ncbi:MAG: tail fiber protein [Capsulimonas sp.]|uniref:phage tail protein n=1 Tax=Capsulimonas sp. TaxID=2494211 RepID=UPI003262CE9E